MYDEKTLKKGLLYLYKEAKKEVEKSEEVENPLLLAYSKMSKAIQDMGLDQAKDLYTKDVNIKKMNVTHEKFFRAAQKSYILKVLGA